MRPDFDRLADIYDETRCCSPELTGRVASYIVEILGQGSSLLDIGAGTGRFLAPLESAGIAAFGADLSVEMMRRARSKGLRDLVIADGRHLPFLHESFDGALIVNVLHLVEDWVWLLQEAARVTRKAIIAIDIRSCSSAPYNIMLEIFESRGLIPNTGGLTESALGDLCAPDRKIDLGTFSETQLREDVISAFENRSYAFQIAADDSEHEILMRVFSNALKSDEIVVERSIEMLVWEPRKIELFARERTFG